MHRIRGQCRTTAAAILAVASLVAGAAVAQMRSFHFDVQDQPLSQALQRFGQVSGQQIVFTEALVAGLASPSLKGEFTAEAALEHLLHGSGLVAERSSSGVFMIRRTALPATQPPQPTPVSQPVQLSPSPARHSDSENPA